MKPPLSSSYHGHQSIIAVVHCRSTSTLHTNCQGNKMGRPLPTKQFLAATTHGPCLLRPEECQKGEIRRMRTSLQRNKSPSALKKVSKANDSDDATTDDIVVCESLKLYILKLSQHIDDLQLQLILKDHMQHIGKLICSNLGARMDSKPKRWRILADVLYDLRTGLEGISPSCPYLFLEVAGLDNFAKGMAMVAARATRLPIYSSFAKKGNLSDLFAKEPLEEAPSVAAV